MLNNIAKKRVAQDLPHFVDLDCLNILLARSSVHRLKNKEALVRAGDTAKAIFFVIEGTLDIVIIDEDGQEMIVSNLHAGDFVGELGLFGQEETVRSAWVLARGEARVSRLDYKSFVEISKQFPDLVFLVTNQIVKRLRTTTEKLGNMVFSEVTQRIKQCLFELSSSPDAMSHPDGKQIKLSRRDLSLMVGCSREMAGKVLKELAENNLIDASGKTILIKNSSLLPGVEL